MNSEVQNTVVFYVCLVITTNCSVLRARKNVVPIAADTKLPEHKHQLTL